MSRTPLKNPCGMQWCNDFMTPHRKPLKLRQKCIDFNEDAFEKLNYLVPVNQCENSSISDNDKLTKKIAKVFPMPRTKPPTSVTVDSQILSTDDHPVLVRPRQLTVPVTPRFLLPSRIRPKQHAPSIQSYRTPPMSPNTRKTIVDAVVKRLYQPKQRNCHK